MWGCAAQQGYRFASWEREQIVLGANAVAMLDLLVAAGRVLPSCIVLF